MDWTSVRQRGLALGLGTGLTLSALGGAVVVQMAVLIAARLPDRLAMDGDPCCPVPDSWAAVAAWSMIAVLLAAIDAAVLIGGVASLYFGVRHRPPHWGLALLVPAVAAAAAGVIVLALIVQALVAAG